MFSSSRFCSLKDGKLELPSFDEAKSMSKSMGVGIPLVSHNNFGADLIHFKAGEGVQNHTHPGCHILFCLKGSGYVIYEGVPHKMDPGFCYFVEGQTDHAIKAETDLTLIACGNDHFSIDSEKRMEPVSYREETSEAFRIT